MVVGSAGDLPARHGMGGNRMDHLPPCRTCDVEKARELGIGIAPRRDRVIAVEQRIRLELGQIGAVAREGVALVLEFGS